MTPSWQSRLPMLDQQSPDVIDALAFSGQPRIVSTFSRPLRFVAVDGKTYWVKHHVQNGLVVELIVGRLAAAVGVGPIARILRVSTAALPAPGNIPEGVDLAPYLGEVVGSEDVPGTENARELAEFIGSGTFSPNVINVQSRAASTTFQTWIGAADEQVLVRLTDGRVFSIDHGGCFSFVGDFADPSPVLVQIPGVPAEVGREWAHIEPTVRRIEAISDDDLMKAVDRVPADHRWQSDGNRRLAIAAWLAFRRDRLRGVMESWAL